MQNFGQVRLMYKKLPFFLENFFLARRVAVRDIGPAVYTEVPETFFSQNSKI
jgi:hypothetical protein